MAKGYCPTCDTLQDITPGERQHPKKGTSCWWLVSMHKHPLKEEVCDGSGKKI